MRDLNYQLKTLCRHSREGSYATRANRLKMLMQMANQLHELGYRQLQASNLKIKHVDALITLWQNQQIATGTLKNRLAVLRWWAEKVGKHSIMAKANTHYGIANRSFISDTSKAQQLDAEQLAKVTDTHVRMSLELQQAFGLRREEAIKFCPVYADLGDKIRLKSSWTKGGKAREIPIRNALQRDVLDRAHKLAGRNALIPAHRSYIQQLRIYERHTARAGLSKLHGLRHRYAQQRYQELIGWQAPAAGGPRVETLNAEQKAIDHDTRLLISRELGHERAAIVAVYVDIDR